MQYFNDVFDFATWQQKKSDGMCGARETAAGTVREMEVGDIVLLYLMRPYSRWIGAMEILSPPRRDGQPLHGFDDLPYKIICRFVVAVDVERGVGRDEADEASLNKGARRAFIRFAPRRINRETAETIMELLEDTARQYGNHANEYNAARAM